MNVVRKYTWLFPLLFAPLLIAPLLLVWVALCASFAQADDPAVTAPGVTSSGAAGMNTPFNFILGSVNFFLVAFFVYYMLVLRPNQLKEERHLKFVRNLKKDDEVITSGGILGRVREISNDYVALEIANGVRIRVHPEHVGAHPAKPAAQAKTADDGKKVMKADEKERKAK